MRNISILAILLISACQNKKSIDHENYLTEIVHIKNHLLNQNTFNGSILIANKQKQLFAAAYGYKTENNLIKNTLETQYGLA